MLDDSFVEAIATLAERAASPEIIEIHDAKYASRSIQLIAPPQPRMLEVHTLTGIAEYVKQKPDGQKRTLFCHVSAPHKVSVYSDLSLEYATRDTYIEAKPAIDPFSFGSYHRLEDFIIALQARFEPTDDSLAILQLVGNLTDGTISSYNDDGVTQQVTVKSGVARVENAAVPPRVTLAPFRTFLEIDQPESEFVFRMKSGGEGQAPQCALFESDGGAWKLRAIESIRTWLCEQAPELIIIA